MVATAMRIVPIYHPIMVVSERRSILFLEEEEDEDPQDVTLNHGIEIAIEDDEEDAEWDLGTGQRKLK